MTSEQIDALWNISDAKSGHAKLTEALKASPGSADEIHTQLCRALGLQLRFDEAWAELRKVSQHKSAVVQVRYDLEAGRLKNTSGDPGAAKPLFNQALHAAEQAKLDYYAVDAAHMLGIVTKGAESVGWNEKAIAMAQASADPRAQRWQGSLLNNLGWTYHDEEKYEKALTLFREALNFQERFGSPERARIANWTIARCLRSMKRYEEALAIQRELLKFPEQGYVSEEMGELLLATGHPDEAKPYFKSAFEQLSKDELFKAHNPDRLERLKQLSAP